jgi:alanyl aminopeptidase
VRLTQSRATPFGVSQDAKRWQIPVVLKWSDGKAVRTQRVMLKDESAVVKLPAKPAWAMPNGGGRGYYAWSVPEEWMAALAEHADAVLSPDERVAFLGNLALLMTGGEVHGDTYLGSLAHFGRDTEPEVVSSTIEALGGVRTAFVPDSLADLFAVYVRRTLAPAMERIGYEHKPGEDEMVATTRGELLRWLAGRGRDEKAIAFAQQAAARYLEDPAAVEPGIADAALSVAAKTGDETLFETFRKRFESAEVPATRRRYLSALGGFEDTSLTRRALEYMLSEAVRPTEMFVILRGFQGRDEASGERLFRWMMANYPQISTRVPPPALRFMPLMGAGCSAERLAATQAFFGEPAHDAPGVSQSLERVRDMVNTCLSLRTRDGDRVARYMRGFATN